MNETNTIENVTATTPRSYFRTAIRGLLAAGAIAIAAAAPAASQPTAASQAPSAAATTLARKTLWVANGADVLEFDTPAGFITRHRR